MSGGRPKNLQVCHIRLAASVMSRTWLPMQMHPSFSPGANITPSPEAFFGMNTGLMLHALRPPRLAARIQDAIRNTAYCGLQHTGLRAAYPAHMQTASQKRPLTNARKPRNREKYRCQPMFLGVNKFPWFNNQTFRDRGIHETRTFNEMPFISPQSILSHNETNPAQASMKAPLCAAILPSGQALSQ
jgi:hypothetical protein